MFLGSVRELTLGPGIQTTPDQFGGFTKPLTDARDFRSVRREGARAVELALRRGARGWAGDLANAAEWQRGLACGKRKCRRGSLDEASGYAWIGRLRVPPGRAGSDDAISEARGDFRDRGCEGGWSAAGARSLGRAGLSSTRSRPAGGTPSSHARASSRSSTLSTRRRGRSWSGWRPILTTRSLHHFSLTPFRDIYRARARRRSCSMPVAARPCPSRPAYAPSDAAIPRRSPTSSVARSWPPWRGRWRESRGGRVGRWWRRLELRARGSGGPPARADDPEVEAITLDLRVRATTDPTCARCRRRSGSCRFACGHAMARCTSGFPGGRRRATDVAHRGLGDQLLSRARERGARRDPDRRRWRRSVRRDPRMFAARPCEKATCAARLLGAARLRVPWRSTAISPRPRSRRETPSFRDCHGRPWAPARAPQRRGALAVGGRAVRRFSPTRARARVAAAGPRMPTNEARFAAVARLAPDERRRHACPERAARALHTRIDVLLDDELVEFVSPHPTRAAPAPRRTHSRALSAWR